MQFFFWLKSFFLAARMAETIPKPKAKRQAFEFGGWTLTAVESHILQSEGADRER